MGVLLATSIIFAFLTIYFLARTLRRLRQHHFIRAGGSVISCVVSAALTGAAIMFLVSYLSYSRLTDESDVSTIEFRRINPEEFQARLMIDGERDQFFVLRGNEWQMDAKIVTWKPPATILGLEPVYQLDRLSGRYSEIDREQTEARTVHALSPGNGLDVWQIARQFPKFLPGIDAYYGTATYVPMLDGAQFRVSLSRDALIARPSNDIAKQAVGNWNSDEN